MHSQANVKVGEGPAEFSPGDGIAQDDLDMQRLGKKQELKVGRSLLRPSLADKLKRNFRFHSILGFTLSLMATWESIMLTSTYGLINGGRGGMVYVYIGSFIGFFSTVISMAEIASYAPTSGGQYHWVSEFADARTQRFLSYMAGWLSVLGWQAAFASISFLCGTLTQALLVLNYSDPSAGYVYRSERWHGTLLTMAVACIGTIVNTFGASYLPLLEGFILAIHILGFVVILVALWVTGTPATAQAVWTEFKSSGGWPDLGLSCLVGQLTPIFSFLGPDAATHMAEEIKDASRIVPLCMVSTALVNGSLGFIMLITFLYTMGSVESVLKAPSGFAFVSAFHNATGSNAATTGLASIILVLEVCSAISILATTSRQTFAFARDNALPFSRVFAYVPRRSQIPIYSILITTLITALLSLINIGSTAAFNAVASLAIGSLFMTYLFAIGCFIGVRIRSEHLPRARFSLGRFGLPINAFALAYLSFAIIFTFFPTTHDVTPVSMNWSILVLGAVVIFAVVQYVIHGDKIYQAPVSRVQKLQ